MGLVQAENFVWAAEVRGLEEAFTETVSFLGLQRRRQHTAAVVVRAMAASAAAVVQREAAAWDRGVRGSLAALRSLAGSTDIHTGAANTWLLLPPYLNTYIYFGYFYFKM
jgi:hypothetical protein